MNEVLEHDSKLNESANMKNKMGQNLLREEVQKMLRVLKIVKHNNKIEQKEKEIYREIGQAAGINSKKTKNDILQY